MQNVTILRCIALLCALASLSGCAALSSVNAASEPMDTYELTSLPASGRVGAGRRHLLIDAPTVSGALATDRIAIKPNALQIEYLPEARWADEVGAHVQLLLSRSLSGSGRFALVSTNRVRPDPSHVLLVDVEAFQAEVVPNSDAARVVVRLKLTLIDDEEREIVATRVFEGIAPAAESDVARIVPGFDRAMTAVLRDVVGWTVGTIG